MLNTGVVLLAVLIDFLVQILTLVEWITPSKNIFLIALTLLCFRSRWTWNAFIPSILVYFLPNIKVYIQTHISTLQEMSKLDLLLNANSLTQHALFLKDRLYWLYREEINFFFKMMQGDLSFKARLLLITIIFSIFGFLNWTSAILEVTFLHFLIKHSRFGSFYRGIGKDFLRFADFALFYKNLKDYPLYPPFRLEGNEFTIAVIELIDLKTNDVYFTSETKTRIDPDFLILLKPIVNRMTASISEWAEDPHNPVRFRTWKWSRIVLFDYNSDELDYFGLIYQLIIA